MNRKKWMTGAALAACAACAVLIWRLQSPETASPEFVLNYAENQTDDYPTTMGAKYFAQAVEERTGGRIQVLVQANAELGAEKDVLKQMQYGGIDFSRVSLSQIAEIIPEMNALQLPYLYDDSAHMWRVLDGDIGDEFLELVEKVDLVGLSWYDAGVRSFYTSQKKITCLEDFKGMIIRVQESEMMSDMVTALGATAIQTPYSEVYSSIQQNLVDGAENNWPSYETMRHYEVAPYYTVDEHARVPEMQIIAKSTWDKLSPEDREIIRECAEESSRLERRIWKQRERQSMKTAQENGTQIIEISNEEKERFREAVMPVYEKYCGDDMELIEEIRAQREE